MNPFHRTTLGLSEKDKRELRSMKATPQKVAEQTIEEIRSKFEMTYRSDWLKKIHDDAQQQLADTYKELRRNDNHHHQDVLHDKDVLTSIVVSLLGQRKRQLITIESN